MYVYVQFSASCEAVKAGEKPIKTTTSDYSTGKAAAAAI